MKSVNPKAFKDYEYRAEKNAIKKETKNMRSQRRNRKSMWSNAE